MAAGRAGPLAAGMLTLILLTRDRGLLKRSIVTYGRYVRATDPRFQVAEIVRRYELAGRMMPYPRVRRTASWSP